MQKSFHLCLAQGRRMTKGQREREGVDCNYAINLATLILAYFCFVVACNLSSYNNNSNHNNSNNRLKGCLMCLLCVCVCECVCVSALFANCRKTKQTNKRINERTAWDKAQAHGAYV